MSVVSCCALFRLDLRGEFLRVSLFTYRGHSYARCMHVTHLFAKWRATTANYDSDKMCGIVISFCTHV